MRGAAILIACAAAACSEPLVAPAMPSWQTDVMPLFAANCVRCHMYPHRGDGQTALRLDSFDDTLHPGGRVAKGASPTIGGIFRRTHDIALLPDQRTMPPDRPLTEYELEVVRNWASLGDGERAVRGAGREDNHAPTITLTESYRDSATIRFAYDVQDRDRDLVVVTFGVQLASRPGDRLRRDDLILGNAIAGTGESELYLDELPKGFPGGDFAFIAQLDDGADVDPEGDKDFVQVDLGMISLPPGPPMTP